MDNTDKVTAEDLRNIEDMFNLLFGPAHEKAKKTTAALQETTVEEKLDRLIELNLRIVALLEELTAGKEKSTNPPETL